MTKELRRLGVIVVFMFLSLFVATSIIQVVQAPELNADPKNSRTLYESFEVQRGSIVAGGVEIATSAPSNDVYSWQRWYENSGVWSSVTGWMNPAVQNATGLEFAANEQLSGQASSAFFARIERIITGQDPRGSSVETSLDPAAQQAAYDALGDNTGSVVAIEPSTGRIIAMVSKPSFDANTLASHSIDEALDTYEQLESAETSPLINRAISDVLPPASTFKLVVVAAALETGEYTMDSTMPNEVAYRLPETTLDVRNASRGTCGGGDEVTLHDAIRLSCNVPLAELAVELGEEPIRSMAEALGFNSMFETPLASVESSYPSLGGDEAQLGLTGFGQGPVTATPLQMAMTAAAIANDGTEMRPWMIDQVVGPDLSVQESFSPQVLREAMSAETANAVTEAMVSSVEEGVATRARIEGVEVAGKTGTAEMGAGLPYSLWFTGFAPADDPQIAVAVVVENGGGQGQSGSGDSIAAPIAKSVMEAVLRG